MSEATEIAIERAALKEMAKEAGREGARETLLMLGIDASTPKGVQRAQRNFMFLDDLVVGTQTIKRRSLTVIVTIVVTTILGWIAIGMRH